MSALATSARRIARALRAAPSSSACALALAACAGLAPQAEAPLAPLEPASAVAEPAFDDPLREAIEPAELEAHVRFLASDELEGRATASAGERRAARRLARVLERAGYEPGGTDGFLQAVPLERSLPAEPLTLTLERTDGEPLLGAAGLDFDLDPSEVREGELAVRVVRGAAEVGAPDARVALFVDGSSRELRAWLEEAGAPGGRGFGLVLRPGLQRAREGEPRRARERLVREPTAEARGGGPAIGRVHGALLDALRAGEVRALRLSGGLKREAVTAWNVVGILRGAGSAEDPAAAEQALVLSAHYDHIGLVEDPAPGADSVYNGADDNASGTAAVLEIAEALALGPRPAHSLVVLLATGEELGLLGTDHYVEQPAWPLARTLYDLNLEMLGRPDELAGGAGVLWLVGWELSNVGPALAERGLAVVADPRPEQSFFWRSDNISFVRQGIVAQTLSSYGMHADYHRASDEADTLDYEHLARGARTALEAARAILSGALRPAWAPGFDPRAPRGR